VVGARDEQCRSALTRRRNRDRSGRRSEMDTTALPSLARSACTKQSRTILTAAGSSARVRGESMVSTTRVEWPAPLRATSKPAARREKLSPFALRRSLEKRA
jgi:hypothetical protein